MSEIEERNVKMILKFQVKYFQFRLIYIYIYIYVFLGTRSFKIEFEFIMQLNVEKSLLENTIHSQ